MSSLLSSIFRQQQAPTLRSISSSTSTSNKTTRMSMFSFIWKVLLPMLTLLWLVVIVFSHSASSSSSLRRAADLRAESTGSTSGLRGTIKSFSDIIAQKASSSLGKINNSNSNSISTSMSTSKNSHDLHTHHHLEHVVVVTGHAAMRLSMMKDAIREDNAWYLLPYQRDQNFPAIISSHIQTGIALTLSDPNAVLVFSGGQTRRDVGPISEAASYYYLSESQKWLSSDLIDRTILEEHARDSFENMLFSICRFKEATGKYPRKVSIIGFDFKSQRFTDVHRRAINFPEVNFSYVGVPPTGKFDRVKAASGELEVLKSFGSDIYGCSDPSLKAKRELRNPFRRTIPYELSCPELKGLFNWCGPDIYPGLLPWSAEKEAGESEYEGIKEAAKVTSNSGSGDNSNNNYAENIELEKSGGRGNEVHRDFQDPAWASIKE